MEFLYAKDRIASEGSSGTYQNQFRGAAGKLIVSLSTAPVNSTRRIPAIFLISGRRPAPIDAQYSAIYEGCLLRAQVKGHVRDLIRPSQTPNRLPLIQFGADLIFLMFMIFFEIALDKRRVDRSGRDAVDPDFGRIVHGKLSGHCHHCSLGTAVRKAPLDANQTCNGTDVDNATFRRPEEW